MKALRTAAILVAGLALVAPAAADDERRACSVRKIAGRWVFATGVGQFPAFGGDITAIGTMNIDREGDLSGKFDATVAPLLQRLAVQILHHQVVDAVLLPDVENGADVRVAQRGQRFGFTLEALLQGWIARDVQAQDLDGDVPVEPRIVRPIHLAHATGLDQRLDAIGTERVTWCQTRRLLRRCKGRVVAESSGVLVRGEHGDHLGPHARSPAHASSRKAPRVDASRASAA